MSIYLNEIFSAGAFTVKERYGKEFNKIRKLQPKDSISCRYVVYRGEIQLEEFRRKQAALNFAADEAFRESHSGQRQPATKPATRRCRGVKFLSRRPAMPEHATAGPTPGPWELAAGNPHCILAPAPTGLAIVATLPKDGTQLPQTKANARLIASAPELLATLEKAEEILAVALAWDSSKKFQKEIRAVIAKARGGSPSLLAAVLDYAGERPDIHALKGKVKVGLASNPK